MIQTSVKKETSIDWLINQLYKKGFIKEVDGNEPINLMNEAKEMEKQQIIEAHGDKKKTKSNPDSIVTYGYTYTGKDYYNDKYEKL